MVFSDDVQAQFGGNVDLRIYSDDENSYIDNENNDLIIQNDVTDKDIILKTDDGSGGVILHNIDGSVVGITAHKNLNVSGFGTAIRFDTDGSTESNIIQTINDFETLIATNRGSAGHAVIGHSNIRLGFGTNYTAAEAILNITPAGKISGSLNSSGSFGQMILQPVGKLFFDGGGHTYIQEEHDILNFHIGGLLAISLDEVNDGI